MKKFSLIFLGCPKNQVDCEKIVYSLLKEGYFITTNLKEAEIVILTTCAFIKQGVKECENWLKKLIALKKKGVIKKIILYGCLVEREREGLIEKYPEVDCFVGLGGLNKIPLLIKKKENYYLPKNKQVLIKNLPRIITEPFSYVKIADGCNNCCSYCLIPKIRGKYQSREIKEIKEEVKELVDLGIKEIILIAQDTTLYGIDIYQKPSLAKLLKELIKIKNLKWLRILYTHPAHYDDELIRIIKDEEKIVKYLDIPIQHASNRILKLMNRPYTQKDLIKLLEKLRKIPNLVLRTTVMVGFPYEEEKDFLELLSFIKDFKFEYLGCFIYSREENTFAYNLEKQIKENIKKERYQKIMETQQKITFNFLNSLKGKIFLTLMENKNLGRAYFQAPEIDGYVIFNKKDIKIGEFANCKILERKGYDLVGKIIEK
ncbi:MAG: 30S ribosomal protein S12 methylthiotransferase RimO [candidate division WOR-3 bacterium]|nr:30S ribosomal protein S12 methylthiotransferase RimO [candidate division WOR-3 bacterium]MDW8113626.1 30S ribosomal protein S12 methylthiotransferase RimO [candidate division WOR-3 bacterium]